MKLTKPSSSQLLLYSFFTAAIISIIAYNIISWNFNKDLNLGVEIIEFVISVIVILQLLLMLRSHVQFSSLILIFVQAFACFALGELFWILHIYIKQFEPVGSFSISDLSWIGFYAFILTAYRDIFNKQPAKKIQKNTITILFTIPVLFTIVAGFTLLYFTGDDIIYTIIYLAPCLMIAYYSVKHLMTSKDYKLVHINILLLIYADLLSSIAINFDFEIVYLLKLVFGLLLLCITPALLLSMQKTLDKQESVAKEEEMVEV